MVWRLLIFVVLIAGVVGAQTSPRLDSISAAVRDQVGASTSYTVGSAVNRAYLQVCYDYPAIPKIDTVVIDSAHGYVALPSDFVGMESCNLLVLGMKIPMYALSTISQDSAASIVRSEMNDTDPTDQQYYLVHGSALFTYPRWIIGSDSADLEIRYFAVGPYLTAASDTIRVAVEYRNAVFYYACAEVQAKRGRYGDASYYRQLCWSVYGAPIKREEESR